MQNEVRRIRLDTQALVVGYAMSRLDGEYLAARGCQSWKEAFAEAGTTLRVPPTSLKNLRDEFDPFHSNSRKGWHKRALRKNRQRVLDELATVSDDGLLAIVARIVGGDEDAVVDAIDSLADVERTTHNVAERLLTGRRAEEYFVRNCAKILDIFPDDLIDARELARGYDFGIRSNPNRAIEIKGLKTLRGDLLFTDREWNEAKFRAEDYFLVVVANLATRPRARVVQNPHAALDGRLDCRTSVTVSWRVRFSASSKA